MFTPAATRKFVSLKIDEKREIEFLKKVWMPSLRVEKVAINCRVSIDDLEFIFGVLKPRAISYNLLY